MTFFRNVLGTFGTEVLTVGLNMLLGILTARLLGPERRGILTLVMTLPLTLVHFADLGVSQANIYLIGRRKRPAGAILINSLVIALSSGLVIAAVLWLLRDLVLDKLLSGLPAPYFAAILLLLPLLLLYTYWMAILRAWERFRLVNLLLLLMPVSLLICVTPALLIFRGQGSSLEWATAAYLGGSLLAIGVGLFVVGRQVRLQSTDAVKPFDSRLARESLGYGLKSYFQNLMGHLAYRLDIYLVALFLDPRDVAFYSIAVSIAELAWYVPNSVGIVLFPKLSNEVEERIHPLTAEVCRHTFAITLLATVGVTIAGIIGIPLLYGAEYRPAIFPLLALGPGIVVMSLYKVLTRNFSSRNRQQVSVITALIGLALNVVLNVLLIPRLGTIGAALASSCAYVVMSVVLLVAFQRESQLTWRQIALPGQDDWKRYTQLGLYVRTKVQQRGKPVEGQVEG
jgi:O-antigen/teichoic acid export membrane protein